MFLNFGIPNFPLPFQNFRRKKNNVVYTLLCVILFFSIPSRNSVKAETSEDLCKLQFNEIWRNVTNFKNDSMSHSPKCYINKPKDLRFTCISNETISIQNSFYEVNMGIHTGLEVITANCENSEFAITCKHQHKIHFEFNGITHDVPIMVFKSPEMGPSHEYLLTYSFNVTSTYSTGKYTVTSDSGHSTSLYIFFTDNKSQSILHPDFANQPVEITLPNELGINNLSKSGPVNVIPCRSSKWNASVKLFNLNHANAEMLDWPYDARIGFLNPSSSLIPNSTFLLCTTKFPAKNDSLLFKALITDNIKSDNDTSAETDRNSRSKIYESEEDDDSIVKFEKTMATCYGKGSARFHTVVNIHTYNPDESQLYNFINQFWVQQWIRRNNSNTKLPLDNHVKIEMCNGAQWCNIENIFPTGLILCLGTDENSSFILRQEYFTCLHGVKFPHIKSRDLVSFPLEALLQMKLLTDVDKHTSDENIEVEVECTTVKYIFMNPNKWTLSYRNYNDILYEVPGDSGFSLEYAHESLSKNIEIKTFKLNRNFNDSVEINCEATFWDTSYTKSYRLKLPKRYPAPLSGSKWIVIFSCMIIVFTAAFGILYFMYKRSKTTLGFSEAQIRQFMEGNPEAFFKSKEKKEELLPYDINFEISEGNYEIFKSEILGSGEFGIVYKGRVHQTPAAVKTIKIERANNEYLLALLSELKIMIYLEKHENVINLIGASTKNLNIGQAYIFVEYCPLGSLESYLRNHRGKLHTSEGGYTIKDLVNWSYQIASGMEHLSMKHVIHSDLATRNVLLKDRYTIKISDFGLSRKLYNYKHYIKKNESTPLPWRWMSIESLRHLSFSCQSDVWSYGITIWEIFSLGRIPYVCLSWNESFVEKLAGGLRNQKPVYASESIYDVMKQCWHQEPNMRPSFTNLKIFFSNLLTQWTKESEASSQSTEVPYVMLKNDLGYTMLVW